MINRYYKKGDNVKSRYTLPAGTIEISQLFQHDADNRIMLGQKSIEEITLH